VSGINLDNSSRQPAKSDHKPAMPFLVIPNEINQLFLAGFSEMRIPRRRQPIFLVMDCFSRYLLTLKVYPKITDCACIDGLESAFEEAMKYSHLNMTQHITLITGDEPVMFTEKIKQYLEKSPFNHIQGRTRYPNIQGMFARLIFTVKEEGIVDYDYRTTLEAQQVLDQVRFEYNHVRPHQSLKYLTPFRVYTGK
jgi:transposase InsO family protein